MDERDLRLARKKASKAIKLANKEYRANGGDLKKKHYTQAETDEWFKLVHKKRKDLG